MIEDSYSLSPLQQGMLFNALLEPRSGVDIEQLCCELHEALDVAAFQRAWRRVVTRHPVLRTSLRWEDLDEPKQEVHAQIELPWEERDWRGIAAGERDKCLEDFLDADRRRGFDLARAPLFRLSLLQCGEAEFHFIWTFHHTVLEGRSYTSVLQEVFAFYEAFRGGNDLVLPQLRPYRDYIDWLLTQDFSKDEAFWRETLKGFTVPTPLIVDHAPDTRHGSRPGHGTQECLLPAQITSALHLLARENQLTLNAIVQGAWALLLSRYSGEPDVVFGVIRGNRRSTIEGAEAMVGLFLNTLPLRVRVDPEAALLPWLREVRRQWMAMRGKEHSPLAKVQGWSEVPRGTSLFHSTMMFENYHLETMLRKRGGAWSNRRFRLLLQTNYPLGLAAYDGTELRLRIDFDRGRIDGAVAGRMLGHVRTLLEAMAIHPQQKLCELPLLNSAERRQMLVEWNQTAAAYPENLLLHDMFEAQVERTPNAIAVTFEEQHLTYRELNRRSNKLAHHLSKLGVGPDVLVGICAERSLEMVVGLLGVLKAGGAYVPIDPTYPAERVAFMLRDARAPVVLAQQNLTETLPIRATKVVGLNDKDWTLSEGNYDNPSRTAASENLAYMIYTSGSTGKPNGVMISHRAIVNHMLWMQATFPMNERDCVLQKTPFSFDASVWEFFMPLIVGGRLVVARSGGHQDSAYLVSTIIQQQITVLQLVPSLLRMLLETRDFRNCRSLRHVFCGGEVMAGDIPRLFFAALNAELHNLYGPTEATIDSIYYSIPRNHVNEMVPIGRPVANTQAYVLDQRCQPVPIGVPGELYLGGNQVSRGYYNQPELTAERFIPDVFRKAPGAQLYKTGDKVRFRPDGNLEILGRLDFQIKLRGYRIELGEIEASIARHPAVRQVVVIAREDIPEDKRLVAYLVTQSAPADLIDQLRALIRAGMPEYMVPAYFVGLDALPLAPNGKIDRSSLPSPRDSDHALASSSYVAPRNDLEISLATAWEKVLGVQRVGVADSYFELGGNSLSALKLILEMKKATGIEIDLGDLFEFPTIAGLVSRLGPEGTKNASVVVPLQREGDGLPIFCICGINVYKDFAESLGKDQPVFGVYVQEEQAIINQVIQGERPAVSIGRMVEAYDKAISRIQPDGPFRLAGLSFGGILAMELASRLRRRGCEVDVVILLDTVHPRGRHRNWIKWFSYLASEIVHGNAPKKIQTLLTNLQNRLVRRPSPSGSENGVRYVEEEFVSRQRAVFSQAASKWQTNQSVADFRVILFRAIDHSMWGSYMDFDEDYGWRRFLGDRLYIVNVIGGHLSIIEPPNVSELGRTARHFLRSDFERNIRQDNRGKN